MSITIHRSLVTQRIIPELRMKLRRIWLAKCRTLYNYVIVGIHTMEGGGRECVCGGKEQIIKTLSY